MARTPAGTCTARVATSKRFRQDRCEAHGRNGYQHRASCIAALGSMFSVTTWHWKLRLDSFAFIKRKAYSYETGTLQSLLRSFDRSPSPGWFGGEYGVHVR